jgi:hypothetical protein
VGAKFLSIGACLKIGDDSSAQMAQRNELGRTGLRLDDTGGVGGSARGCKLTKFSGGL